MYDNHETADATGGTGRFASATGHWESGGQIDFTTEPLSFVTPFSRVDLNCRLEQAVGISSVQTKTKQIMKTDRSDLP